MDAVPDPAVEIDEHLVRRLLAAQAPDLADLPLQFAANGWDNAMWRLGDELAVRLPRRELGAPLLEHEQRLLPVLAPLLPIPIPAPLVDGQPMPARYPWRWSVVPWYAGDRAETHPPDPAQSASLGRFLAALHAIPPAGLPSNPFRGGPLAIRVDRVAARVDPLRDGVDHDLVVAAHDAFQAGLDCPPAATPAWIHGDLHPRNVLTRDGQIAAVLDWGDTTAGDPAVDLAAIWWLFEPEDHGAAWQAYGSGSVELWLRSRAWAAYFGLMFLGFQLADDPTRLDLAGVELGRRQLRRVRETVAPPDAQPE
jgi:aminoglycoside phosphotransferase (APT) family kinase protein